MVLDLFSYFYLIQLLGVFFGMIRYLFVENQNLLQFYIQKGAVFYRRAKNWRNSSDEFQEFAYQRNWGIIEPWDGLAKYYSCLD